MKRTLAHSLAIVAIAFAGTAIAAQYQTQSTSDSPITQPPRQMSSAPNTSGFDSTKWSYGKPGPSNSSITVPFPSPPNPPITCVANSSTVSQTGTCPAGETVNGAAWPGPTTFTQTATQTMSCPAGPYGPPTVTTGPWSPTAATVCQIPSNATCVPGTKSLSQTATCPAGELVVNGTTTTFTQTSTQTTTCPAGYFGAPSVVTTPWSPTTAAKCAAPLVSNVQIGVNNMATTYAKWAPGDNLRAGGNPAPLSAHFSGTLSWNGASGFFNATCSGTAANQESCTGSVNFVVGGVTWRATINGADMLKADCYVPPNSLANCTLTGTASLSP